MSISDASRSGRFAVGGDIEVNRLGFGAMRITGKGIWGEPKDRDEALRTLKRLPELSVEFIDTADSYGPVVSEVLIREALHPYPAGTLIATKAGLTRTGPGTGKVRHLEENVAAAGIELSTEEFAAWTARAEPPGARRPDPPQPG